MEEYEEKGRKRRDSIKEKRGMITCLHSLYLPFSKWRLLGDIHLSV